MQLKYLYIKDYKILKDFHIDFPHDFKKYISVFIGANGSGKSTILEAITQIFSNVYLNEKAKFGFELEYSVRHEKSIEETSTTSETQTKYLEVKLSANERDDDIKIESGIFNIKGNTNILLPDNVIIYYSGLSKIMQELVKPHNDIISTVYRKINSLGERNFFYFQPEHFGIILTSLLSFEYGDIPKFLFEKAKISGVQSIQISLKKPEWANDTIQNFWGAKGEVRNFLDYLNENTASVEDLQNPDQSKGIGNIVIEVWQNEALNITIISQQKLFEIRDHLIEERKLFEILNIMLYDGMLNNISFSLYDESRKGFGVLSEGEQQTIIIKGLIEFLSEKNSLFLFDEPDTYLHPEWQRQLISEIENTIESSHDIENSFIIATHSPQLLSNAKSEMNFVKIIEDGALVERTPRFYGREINTILYELMDVEERNEEIRKSISNLFTLIEEEEIEEAEKTLKKLQEIIGEDDPELLRASIQIEYLKEDE